MKQFKNSILVAWYCFLALFVIGVIYTLFMFYMHEKSKNTNHPNSQNISTTHHFAIHGGIPYWEQEAAFKTSSEHVEMFDYISVFWYVVNEQQQIVAYQDAVEDQNIIDYAHQHNVKVLALIANLPDYENADWDSDSIRAIIADSQKRKQHIEDISFLLQQKNFDGVNIDYEELDDDLRNDFSVFIQELADELHKQNKLVGVAIHPKTAENIDAEDNGSRAQDWQKIAAAVDQFYIMAYGEHWDGSNAGPIASIDWDTRLIRYAKQQELPLERVYLGTPLYAVRWEKGSQSGEGLLYNDVLDVQSRFNSKTQYDTTAQSPFITYKEYGTEYTIWFENAQSVTAKVALAKKSGLGGVSFWALGGEDAEVWKKIAD